MVNKININDFIWAKQTHSPPWPSMVVEPVTDAPAKPSSKHENMDFHWVYFFGSHNYAWVEECHIKPYIAFRDKYITVHKTPAFTEAVNELDNILKELDNNSNYKVHLLPFVKKKRTVTKRTKEPIEGTSNKRPRLAKSVDAKKNDTNTPTKSFTSFIRRAVRRHSQLESSYEVLPTNNIKTSNLTFGVLGIGIIGSEVVKNLIQSGHKVNMWNRTARRCSQIELQLGSKAAGYLKTLLTPRAVLENSDIVFNCVLDHNVSKKIIQTYFGINDSSDDILNKKGFVEMTGIDPETSKDISDMIEKKGGRYLEAQIQGSKNEADEGILVILAAGNYTLFRECQSCFKSIAMTNFFLGDVGYATKMYLILQLIKGVCLVGLAEGLALAERSGLSLEEFYNLLNVTNLRESYFTKKAKIIVNRSFTNVEQSLQNMQKDMKLGLELSNRIGQPMHVASAANEIFKHCLKFFGDQDSSAIFMRTRF